MSSNRLYIGGSNSGISRWNLELRISWQAQYLVKLEVDFACSAHWKWRFIWDADQSWDAFCVAGAVFGEVGVWLFVAGAAFGDILGDSRSAKRCIFQYKIVVEVGRVRPPKRRVRDAILWSDYVRIMFGMSSIVFLLAEAIHGVSAEILNLQISWQAQYLVRLEADCACSAHCKWRFIYVTRINHEIHFAWQAQYMVKLSCDVCCSAHCKWRFICDADQSWDSFCEAGAVFGEVRCWLCLLRAF